MSGIQHGKFGGCYCHRWVTGSRKMGSSKSAELTVPSWLWTRFPHLNTISITVTHPGFQLKGGKFEKGICGGWFFSSIPKRSSLSPGSGGVKTSAEGLAFFPSVSFWNILSYWVTLEPANLPCRSQVWSYFCFYRLWIPLTCFSGALGR